MRVVALVVVAGCGFGKTLPAIVDDAPGSPDDASPGEPTMMTPDARISFIFEAEAYSDEMPTGTHDWTEVTTIPGYSSNGYMILMPDDSAPCGTQSQVKTCAASLIYRVMITEPRDYFFFARLYASSSAHDSVWFGIDNTVEEVLDHPEDSTWKWIAAATPRNLSAGMHALHIWQREGARLDRVALMPTNAPPP